MSRLGDLIHRETKARERSELSELVGGGNAHRRGAFGDACAEAARVMQTVNKLAKTDQDRARVFLRDPDNAVYAVFRHDLAEMTKSLQTVDEAKQLVEDSNLSDAEKKSRLQMLGKVRGNVLAHADALNNLLFRKRMGMRAGIPMTAPRSSISAPAN